MNSPIKIVFEIAAVLGVLYLVLLNPIFTLIMADVLVMTVFVLQFAIGTKAGCTA